MNQEADRQNQEENININQENINQENINQESLNQEDINQENINQEDLNQENINIESDQSEQEKFVRNFFESMQKKLQEQEKALQESQKREETLRQQASLIVKNSDSKIKSLELEFDNFRKRELENQKKIRDQANEEILKRILSVRDDLERGLIMLDKDENNKFYLGYKMSVENIIKFLDEMNVCEININIGDKFNPDEHDAISHIEDLNMGENVIANIVQKGYKYKNKIIRYAKVIVAN